MQIKNVCELIQCPFYEYSRCQNFRDSSWCPISENPKFTTKLGEAIYTESNFSIEETKEKLDKELLSLNESKALLKYLRSWG